MSGIRITGRKPEDDLPPADLPPFEPPPPDVVQVAERPQFVLPWPVREAILAGVAGAVFMLAGDQLIPGGIGYLDGLAVAVALRMAAVVLRS